MISFTQFHYFITVAEEKSFTNAAKKLAITQQALSSHIQNIENELGTRLFNRTSPLSLTYSGQKFYKYALDFCSMENNLYSEMNDISNQQVGTYRIGLSYNRGAMILPKILPVLREEFSNVEFHFKEANYTILQNMLANQQLDIIIEQLPFSNPKINHIEICSDSLYLMFSNNYLRSVFGEDADIIKNILYSTGCIKPLDRCTFLLNNVGNSIRQKIDDIMIEEDISARCLIETENMDTLFNLCFSDYGVTFIPELFLKSLTTKLPPDINLVPLKYPSTNYKLAIGYLKGHYVSKVTLRIADLLKKKG